MSEPQPPRWPDAPLEAHAAHWEAGPLFAAFGIELEALDEGYARLGVDRDSVPLRGVRDSLNGGVLSSLAGAAAQLCATTVLRADERLGSLLEVSVSYLSSARGERTTTEAHLLRRGGRLAVADVEIRDAADGAINAKARVTCGIVRTSTEGRQARVAPGGLGSLACRRRSDVRSTP